MREGNLSRDAQSNLSGERDVVICLHELGKLEIRVGANRELCGTKIPSHS